MPEGAPGGSRGTVVRLGTFDGVHRGHQLVLQRTADAASCQSQAQGTT